MPQIVTQQEQEIEVDMWHDPEIEETLRKAKQIADSIGENKGYSLTAGNGAEEGDKIEGFKVDGHTKHIKPGDGGGIHQQQRLKKEVISLRYPRPQSRLNLDPALHWILYSGEETINC